MGLDCGYVAPSAGLVRGQGPAVMGCGRWLGLAVLTAAGLGSVLLGVAVPAGVRVGVFRLLVRLLSSGRAPWRWLAG